MDKDKVECKGEQMKGKAREFAGKVTGDEDTEAEGKAEQAGGKVQETYGDAKDKVRDAAGNVKDKVKDMTN